MKKVCYTMAIATMCIATSCTDSGTNTTSGNNADSTEMERNMAKSRSIYKAIEKGDGALIDTLIADDAVDHQGPNGTPIKGGDSIRHFLTDMHNHVSDLKFDMISDAARGDYIFSMVQISGTMKDNMMGMPAGTKMDEKTVDVIKVKDGKMVEHWGFMDPNEMMKQMKAMPMPMDSTGKMNKK